VTIFRSTSSLCRPQIDILTAPRSTEQQQQQPSGSNLAAIVAPSVIGGLLLAGAAAALVLALLRRSHSRRSGTPSPPLLPLTDKRDAFSTGGTAKSGSSGGGGDASPRAPGDAVVQRASLPGFFRCGLVTGLALPLLLLHALCCEQSARLPPANTMLCACKTCADNVTAVCYRCAGCPAVVRTAASSTWPLATGLAAGSWGPSTLLPSLQMQHPTTSSG
jgi:hypothetical protein